MKSFLVVLCLTILFLGTVSAQEDFCCPSETQIPDIRTRSIMQSISSSKQGDCGADGFTYTHSFEFYDTSNIDDLGACLAMSDDDCSSDTDFTYYVGTLPENATLALTGAERGDDRTLYVRAKNCAGYSTRSLTPMMFQKPEVTGITATSNPCGSENSGMVIVSTSDVIVNEVQVCIGDDCGMAEYETTSQTFIRQVDQTRGQQFTVRANATNCMGSNALEQTVSYTEEPDLRRSVSVSPQTQDCGGYLVTASILETIPEEYRVEACYSGNCKDITSLSSPAQFDEDLISFQDPPESVQVTFNITNCVGSEQYTETGTVPQGIKPTIEQQPSQQGCPGEDVSVTVVADMTNFWSTIQGDQEFCMEFDEGTECKEGSPATGNAYSATFTGVTVGDSSNTISGYVNASDACIGSATTSFQATVAPKPAPQKPEGFSAAVNSQSYCAEDADPVSFTLTFDNFDNAFNYSVAYTIGDGSEQTVDTTPTIRGQQTATISDVSPGNNVEYTITALNCIGQATHTGSFTYGPLPQLNLEQSDVNVMEAASEGSECASTPMRDLRLYVSSQGSGVSYQYCITDRGVDTCDDWQTISTLSSNPTADSVEIGTDKDIHVRARYTACVNQDYPLADNVTVPFTASDLRTNVGALTVTTQNVCSANNDDCVPNKVFTVVNDFSEILVQPTQDDGLADVRACWSDSADCDPSTSMTFNPTDQVWQWSKPAGSSDENDYTFHAQAFYCGNAVEDQTVTTTDSLASHQSSDGSNFGVSMSLNSDNCMATISVDEISNYDDRTDSFRYCLGSETQCLDDAWFTTASGTSTMVNVSGIALSSFYAHAFPARCSGYFMDQMMTSTVQTLPDQPQFGSDAAIESEFNQDSDGDCGDYIISISWPEVDGADSYMVQGELAGTPGFTRTTTNNQIDISQDISSVVGEDVSLMVTPLKTCAGGERSSISASATVPQPECGSGSGSGNGDDSGAAMASLSLMAVVFAVLAHFF